MIVTNELSHSTLETVGEWVTLNSSARLVVTDVRFLASESLAKHIEVVYSSKSMSCIGSRSPIIAWSRSPASYVVHADLKTLACAKLTISSDLK